MPTYRWNTSDFAVGYDASAHIVHPHYLEIQGVIPDLLAGDLNQGGLVVDLGGGSGQLMERILDRFPESRGIVIDQSEPFLALAERRLARFGKRAWCIQDRLQSDIWTVQIRGQVGAFVSMSVIHHLEPAEKRFLYQRCHELLGSGGVLLNGDEIRPVGDSDYLATLSAWADHMRRAMSDSSIPPIFHPALNGWIDRNVTHFAEPKKSGDDCHETIAVQLEYFRAAGFTTADAPWQKSLWAILRAVKS